MASQKEWRSIKKYGGYSAFVEFQYHQESGINVLSEHTSCKAEDVEYLISRYGICMLLQRIDLLREQIVEMGEKPVW